MKKIITYIIIYSLTFNVSFGADLPDIKFSQASDRMVYEGIPNTTPKKQYQHALNFQNKGQKSYAAKAYKEFIDQNPDHKLVPEAIYNYGLTVGDNAHASYELLKMKTTAFEILIKNHPEIGDSFYQRAYNNHLYELSRITQDLLLWDKLYKKDKRNIKQGLEFFPVFKKKTCDELISKDPRHQKVLKKFKDKPIGKPPFHGLYKTLKCSQVHGGLSTTVSAPEKTKKTQKGFIVDILAQNNELEKYLTKYQLIFDFENFKVSQLISYNKNNKDTFNFKDVKREFEIVKIDKKQIRMQQSVYDFMSFCRKFNPQFGKYVRDQNYVKSDAPFVKTQVDECNLTTSEFWKLINKNQYHVMSPYVYIDFNFKNYDINKTYYPLNKKMKFSERTSNFKSNVNVEKIVEILFWVAVAYLVVNQIKDIKKISSSTKHSKKVSKNTPSFTSKGVQPSHNDIFFGRYNGNQIYKANQIRFKVLKYYGWGF